MSAFDKQDVERTITTSENKGYFGGNDWAWFYLAEALVKAIVYLADKIAESKEDPHA
jgi:hypothetical protein